MPEVIPFDDESPESVWKRFKFRVIKSGVLSEVSKRKFHLTKSQKRRLKSKKARKRQRRLEYKMRSFENHDREPEKKWVTDIQWPPDMTLKPDDSGYSGFKPQPESVVVQQEPSTHVCGIGELPVNGKPGTVLVKNKPDGANASILFGFPGGGVEPGEAPEDAIVREYEGETGLIINRPSLTDDVVFERKMGAHTFIAFRVTIVGGNPGNGKESNEIEEAIVKDLDSLMDESAPEILKYNHRLALEEYCK